MQKNKSEQIITNQFDKFSRTSKKKHSSVDQLFPAHLPVVTVVVPRVHLVRPAALNKIPSCVQFPLAAHLLGDVIILLVAAPHVVAVPRVGLPVQRPVAAVLVEAVEAPSLAALVLVDLPLAVVQPGQHVRAGLHVAVAGGRHGAASVCIDVEQGVALRRPVAEETFRCGLVALTQLLLVLRVVLFVAKTPVATATVFVGADVGDEGRVEGVVALVVNEAALVGFVYGDSLPAHSAVAAVVDVGVDLDPRLVALHHGLEVRQRSFAP